MDGSRGGVGGGERVRNLQIKKKLITKQPDIPKDGVVKIPKQMDAFEEEESSGHFMAYFVTAVVLCIAGYVLYHNKQKVSDPQIFKDHIQKLE